MIKKVIRFCNNTKDKKKFIDMWKDLMVVTETYNKNCKTYTLVNLNKSNDIYNAELYTPNGLMLENIDKIKDNIEDAFHCKFERSEVKYSNRFNDKYYDVKFIMR